jgi:hypothetical protein
MPDDQKGANQTGQGMIVAGISLKFTDCIKGKTKAEKYK